MNRLACVLGVLALAAVVIPRVPRVDAQSPASSTKEVMVKLHKGENPPIVVLKKQLQSEAPPWGDIQKRTQEFAAMTAGLSKNDPPKGDKASWQALAKSYADNARALDASAQKKDKAAALAAHAQLAGACNNCHNVHRK